MKSWGGNGSPSESRCRGARVVHSHPAERKKRLFLKLLVVDSFIMSSIFHSTDTKSLTIALHITTKCKHNVHGNKLNMSCKISLAAYYLLDCVGGLMNTLRSIIL